MWLDIRDKNPKALPPKHRECRAQCQVKVLSKLAAWALQPKNEIRFVFSLQMWLNPWDFITLFHNTVCPGCTLTRLIVLQKQKQFVPHNPWQTFWKNSLFHIIADRLFLNISCPGWLLSLYKTINVTYKVLSVVVIHYFKVDDIWNLIKTNYLKQQSFIWK